MPSITGNACNANLPLNLSPDTTGQLPDESVATLQQVAEMIGNYRLG